LTVVGEENFESALKKAKVAPPPVPPSTLPPQIP